MKLGLSLTPSKTELKMDYRLKCKNLKNFRKNIANLHDLEVGNDFLDLIPTARSNKGKRKIWTLFYTAKDRIKKLKRQVTNSLEIFENRISNERLVSRT